MTNFSRFVLFRHEDESGISGTGLVAEGILFSTGKCAISWLTEYKSIGLYDCIDDLIKIHGHDGKTDVEWID
jgi:hypothetical protein